MKCKEVQWLIIEDINEPLDSEKKRLVEEHLAGCAECREAKMLNAQIHTAYREMHKVEVDTTPELDAKILGAVHKLMEEDNKKREEKRRSERGSAYKKPVLNKLRDFVFVRHVKECLAGAVAMLFVGIFSYVYFLGTMPGMKDLTDVKLAKVAPFNLSFGDAAKIGDCESNLKIVYKMGS